MLESAFASLSQEIVHVYIVRTCTCSLHVEVTMPFNGIKSHDSINNREAPDVKRIPFVSPIENSISVKPSNLQCKLCKRHEGRDVNKITMHTQATVNVTKYA